MANLTTFFKSIFFTICLYCIGIAVKAQKLPTLIPYLEVDKWGYCDSNGVVRIKPQWYEAELFCGDKAVVTFFDPQRGGRTYGLISQSGEYIIPPSAHWNRQWNGWKHTNLNVHDSNGRYGLIDTNNQLLLPFAYDPPGAPADYLSEHYRPVSVNGKWGLVSDRKEVPIPFRYEMLQELRSRDTVHPAFKAYQNGLWSIIDLHGKTIIPGQYSNISEDMYANAPDHTRNGFILEQQRLVNRHDSSKGLNLTLAGSIILWGSSSGRNMPCFISSQISCIKLKTDFSMRMASVPYPKSTMISTGTTTLFSALPEK